MLKWFRNEEYLSKDNKYWISGFAVSLQSPFTWYFLYNQEGGEQFFLNTSWYFSYSEMTPAAGLWEKHQILQDLEKMLNDCNAVSVKRTKLSKKGTAEGIWMG